MRAVIFDWGGTLTTWHTVDVPTLWRQTYADLTYPDDDVAASALAQILTEVDAAAWASGRIEHRSARLEDILATSARQAGLSLGQLDSVAARTAYEEAWAPHTNTDPSVLPLWTWLRERGIAVGVLSNTIWSRGYHRGLFARDRLYEDVWGPQQVGMRTIHIPHSAIPAAHVVATDVIPDAVAHDLADVAGIVTGWIGTQAHAPSSADAR